MIVNALKWKLDGELIYQLIRYMMLLFVFKALFFGYFFVLVQLSYIPKLWGFYTY